MQTEETNQYNTWIARLDSNSAHRVGKKVGNRLGHMERYTHSPQDGHDIMTVHKERRGDRVVLHVLSIGPNNEDGGLQVVFAIDEDAQGGQKAVLLGGYRRERGHAHSQHEFIPEVQAWIDYKAAKPAQPDEHEPGFTESASRRGRSQPSRRGPIQIT